MPNLIDLPSPLVTISLGLEAVSHAAGGALTGAVGAKVLQVTGHPSYDVLVATRHGATGGALLGVPAALANMARNTSHPTPAEQSPRLWRCMVAQLALPAASGALGAAALHGARGADDLGLGASAFVCLVGETVFAGTGVAVGLLGVAVLTAMLSRQAGRDEEEGLLP